MRSRDVVAHQGRARRAAVVSRSLFIYLLSTWLLVRYFGPGEAGIGRSSLPGIAIVAGFPLVVALAVRLTRPCEAASGSTWGPIVAAVATALLLPLACLQLDAPGTRAVTYDAHSPIQPLVLSGTEGVTSLQATALADAHVASAADGLRLRIRGLSVGESGSTGGDEKSAAEILLNTSLRQGAGGDELVMTVSLIEKENDEIVWSRDYIGDPSDMLALRRLIIRALSEAMAHTREGLSGGQFI